MSGPQATIELSLISHTNVGKTTLARTLLGRNVGEVRDAPHVTASADAHVMIETPAGEALRLWDTPGLGDSVRLAKRLAQSGNPIGWFLSQVWDRWRDRPFWSSQQAIRNVRERADVVLYLVNASEDPAEAGYVEPEMRILDWIGKPVLVLLNQVGEPRPRAEEQAEEERWRAHLAAHRLVRAVLTLDAFARCWVQELVLFDAIGSALPADRQALFGRFAELWRARRLATFDAAIAAIAAELARAACDREPYDDGGVRAKLKEVGTVLGLGKEAGEDARARAMKQLAARLDEGARATTDRLIEIHGLEGRATTEVLARVGADFAVEARASEGKAAALGGVVSGALTGLAADLAAGGLTFGAGLLAGSVLGALGGAGIARGYNIVRGAKVSQVRWSDDALSALFSTALLRYLAVAHYGRGRGEWARSEYPPFWAAEAAAVVAARRPALAAIWSERAGDCDPVRLGKALESELGGAALDLLERLYPGALGKAQPSAPPSD